MNLEQANKAFERYVSGYLEVPDGKVQSKIGHIKRVEKNSQELAKKLGLEEEDIELAGLIGLLHDIGRFEQIKRYHTFVDRESLNHGEFGVHLLFEEGLIRQFIQEQTYDSIIAKAILYHNKSEVPQGLIPKEDLHCRIIRDADKQDILYVLGTDTIENTYCCKDMSQDKIKEEVMRQFEQNHGIDYGILENAAERMVAHIAYLFDLNYSFTREIILEKQYIQKLIHKYSFIYVETTQKLEQAAKIAQEFIQTRICKNQ